MGDLGRVRHTPGRRPGLVERASASKEARPGSPRALNPRKWVRDRDHRPAGGDAEGGPATAESRGAPRAAAGLFRGALPQGVRREARGPKRSRPRAVRAKRWSHARATLRQPDGRKSPRGLAIGHARKARSAKPRQTPPPSMGATRIVAKPLNSGPPAGAKGCPIPCRGARSNPAARSSNRPLPDDPFPHQGPREPIHQAGSNQRRYRQLWLPQDGGELGSQTRGRRSWRRQKTTILASAQRPCQNNSPCPADILWDIISPLGRGRVFGRERAVRQPGVVVRL